MEKAVTIGIIGHTDHGKTSLVRCLTGVETDCTKAEKQRGVSIQCGIAPMETSSHDTVAFIDVPGHEQFLKNTIRGLCAVDMVILVVAADDGMMPQTYAHLELIRHLNIQHGFIILTKADLVDEELLELAELEIRDATEDSILSNMPVIPFSAVNQTGLAEVKGCIESMVSDIPQKLVQNPFRLWIDRVKSFSGVGTVACGTVFSGEITLDNPIVLLPDGRETKARTLEVHNQQVKTARAGQRVGINLPGVSLQEVRCGMTLAAPDSLLHSAYINVAIQASQPIKDRMRVKLYIGTHVANATIVLMKSKILQSGDAGLAQLRIDHGISAAPGDRFVLIMMNMPLVMGGGIVLEMARQKFRKAKAEYIVPFLDAMQTSEISDIINSYLRKYPMRIVGEEEISAATRLPEKKIAHQIQIMCQKGTILNIAKTGFYLKVDYDALSDDIIAIVENVIARNHLKPFINKEEIKTRLNASIDDRLFNHLIHGLTQKGKLDKNGHLYTIPGVTSILTSEQNELADQLLSHSKSIGISPFSAGGFCKQSTGQFEKNHVLKVLNHLCQEGKLIRLGKETFISPMAMQTIKQCVKRAANQKRNIHLSDCKDILGYGRSKGAVVFEYLDNIGFTLRQGDYRVLRN